jgi:hypothetical protein
VMICIVSWTLWGSSAACIMCQGELVLLSGMGFAVLGVVGLNLQS